MPLILTFPDSENKPLWIPPTPSETYGLNRRIKQGSWCLGFGYLMMPIMAQIAYLAKNHHRPWLLCFFCYAIKPFYAFIKLFLQYLSIPYCEHSKFHCHVYGKSSLHRHAVCTPLPVTAEGWVSGTEDGSHLTWVPEWVALFLTLILSPSSQRQFCHTGWGKPPSWHGGPGISGK